MRSGITYHLCAVDGGGTGCRAIITRADGSILARGTGGPANYTTNPDQAAQNVALAVRQAVDSMGNTAPTLEDLVTHVGIAGIMTLQDAEALARHLPFHRCTVSDDRVTSTLGALGARDGAVLAIGTGSFVAVRRAEDIRFFGGWGFTIGDQASGAWLGRAVLEHSLLALDGLEPASDLTRDVLTHFDKGPGGMAAFAAKAAPADFAAFAPRVIAAAASGDPVGHRLMMRGADYLNATLQAAALGDAQPICLMGGVGPNYSGYLAPTYRPRVVPALGTAIDGALHLARQALAAMEARA